MGPVLINGLPAHVLLVHVVVVLVPLTALALVVSAVRPSWIRKLGLALPGLALVALLSVPLTTHAGEWLEHHTDSNALVRRHTELGDGLLPWVIALFVVAAALWWLGRGTPPAKESVREGARPLSVPVRIAAVVVSVVVAGGAVVQVYRIGESGARAAWHDGYSAKPVSGHQD